MTPAYELDLDRVEVKHRARYLGHWSFRSTVKAKFHYTI